MENKTTSIEELFSVITQLREQINVLNTAFSYLPFSLDNETLRPTIQALRFESQNPKRTPTQQEAFRVFVEEIDSRVSGKYGSFSSPEE